jgi:glucose/arabinose dehydrogenase
MFVVEKAGRIKIVSGGSVLPTPFLNITTRVLSTSGERGLLGLAFHPNYDVNGLFYVNYTAQTNGRTRISRFQVSGGDPNVADPTSEAVLLEIAQPFDNHNGGMISFGPDGYLYIGMGDGGSGGDPGNRAQNPDSLLGKMLRIDVDTAAGYKIPPDNPFVAPDTARHEIWAFGMRNPWRWSFDRLSGDLYIADVGQDTVEEVNWQPASSPGGENYGWRFKEGDECYNPPDNCDTLVGLTDPITQYFHTSSRCSITGGYVYRGCAMPSLRGTYFYGDYCTGEVWSVRYDGVSITDSMNRSAELERANFDLVSFGEDALGELYMVGISSGTVFKIVPASAADSCRACHFGEAAGDVNLSGEVTSADIIYLVNYVFKGGAAPLPVTSNGDVDCSGTITSADIIYLVSYVFKGGAPPCEGC